jgi:hypothetical protein
MQSIAWLCSLRGFKSRHTYAHFWRSNSFPQPGRCHLFISNFELRTTVAKTVTGDAKFPPVFRLDGKRFVVDADEKLTAFLELEAALKPFSASSSL